ncbi:12717_t:CDS:2 [Ambispora gerdemannii]|uniref:12717_t:CDS:1 n=1 Tax=Ambispora gerdemannii TaxID=144530 RepID=A0A9N9B8T3_9GLOM|nr:12717_t:CDS:2 [Ambispora gerdemannii]
MVYWKQHAGISPEYLHSGTSPEACFQISDTGRNGHMPVETILNSAGIPIQREVILIPDDDEVETSTISNNTGGGSSTLVEVIEIPDSDSEEEDNDPAIELIYISDNLLRRIRNVDRKDVGYVLSLRPVERRSPSPREGFTTDLTENLNLICFECNKQLTNGMCALFCGHVVCGSCGDAFESDEKTNCSVCGEVICLSEITQLYV